MSSKNGNGSNGNGHKNGDSAGGAGENNGAGRPIAIDATKEAQILAVVAMAGSLNDAADIVGVNRSTITRHKRRNRDFAQRLRQAESTGKMRLVKKLANGTEKGAMFLLERKWWREYARRDSLSVAHSGKVKQDHTHAIADKISSNADTARLANDLARRLAVVADGDDASPN